MALSRVGTQRILGPARIRAQKIIPAKEEDWAPPQYSQGLSLTPANCRHKDTHQVSKTQLWRSSQSCAIIWPLAAWSLLMVALGVKTGKRLARVTAQASKQASDKAITRQIQRWPLRLGTWGGLYPTQCEGPAQMERRN